MERTAYSRMAEIQELHWWYEGRRAILRQIIGGLDLPRPASILEAGSGPGANLAMLAEFGVVSAFEPDREAREHSESVSTAQPVAGSLPYDIPFSGPFDLVCAFDVIEHVEEDLAACRALFDVVRPGGVALVTVPAFRFLWSGHDVANHHFRRYRRPELAALLADSGFVDVRISYFNTLLFPVIAGVRLTGRLAGEDGGTDDAMPRSRSVNTALTRVLASERHLLSRTSLPFGVSLVATGHRAAAD